MAAPRIEPALRTADMQTYAIDVDRRFVGVVCEELGCDGHKHGWTTLLDLRDRAELVPDAKRTLGLSDAELTAYHYAMVQSASDLAQKQAYYIRHLSGRTFTESYDPGSGMTAFTFPAGQRCFESHSVMIDLGDERYSKRGGDWRGNPLGVAQSHDSAEHWLDDFGSHQETISEAKQKG